MKRTGYQPEKKILKKYAEVLVNYALNSGEGMKAGEVVMCVVPDVAKPLALELQNIILKGGGQPMIRLVPTGFDKDFYNLASEEQLKFFPKKYSKAKAELIDHQIGIIAEVDPRELSQVKPAKIMMARNAKKTYRDWLVKKENQGRFTWTIALWGTTAKAKEVGLSAESYWQEIIKACFLDYDDPLAKWRQIAKKQREIRERLNELKIEWVEIRGKEVDLRLKIGVDRVWRGGNGRNIPSFEIFTSPDWRGTEGWIKFNQPVYRYGNIIKGIEMEFEQGKVKTAKAAKGNRLLQEMLKTENADKLGEFSLTDKRMSRIRQVMAETLYDENIGGPNGNMHVAIGKAYHDCYRGKAEEMTKADWKRLGFNDSAEHTDMMSTSERKVTAKTSQGKRVVIYDKGKFVI